MSTKQAVLVSLAIIIIAWSLFIYILNGFFGLAYWGIIYIAVALITGIIFLLLKIFKR